MFKSKISFCIPTFNRENNLFNSLKSTPIITEDYTGF